MPAVMELAGAFVANATAVVAANNDGTLGPDQRFAPNRGLEANSVARVILAILSTSLCWVPFRLLSRNGDFAPMALIVVLAVLNLSTIINACIWSSDVWDKWWDGAVLCDIEVYLQTPLYTAYAASIFAIIFRLADQVKLARATPLNREERAKMAWTQAAIIVPVPLFQMLFTFFDISQRYKIGTLVGCLPVYDVSWPRIVVYEIPSPIFVFASIPFAIIAWKRYRAIVKSTKNALASNTVASARARQARCRLYNMSLSILIIYVPVSLYLMVETLQGALGASLKPYSYNRIHHGNNPYPWDAILFVPSWLMPTAVVNRAWISISTNVLIIAFFGTTKEGIDKYCLYAEVLGFARCFPKLRRPGNEPTGNNEFQQSWIELQDLGHGRDKGKGKEVATGLDRQDSPYPLLGADASFGAEHQQTPGRPLPLPPVAVTPLSERALQRNTQFFAPSSPLQSSRVISSLIPERGSSLNHNHNHSQGQPSPSALRAPAGMLPRITEFPDLAGIAAAGRDIITPWVSRPLRGDRSDDDDEDDDGPPLSPKQPSTGILSWLPSQARSAYRDGSSPRTIDSIAHKTSRDAVQPRSMIGAYGQTPSPLADANWTPIASADSADSVRWPFLTAGGAARTSETTADGKKDDDDEEEEESEDSFVRHRDDPLPPDPWDSPPIRLAPGLEALRPRQGFRRVRIPRTVNVQFDQYVKRKESKESKESKDEESN
ncbi:pheromone A receptor-domain-containing protein [Hypoxylon cercidicola]|nr:pheromone A receptor-domain-containing protein [Hypoxylon cercidicola]